MSSALLRIAICGRPNVGKSSLFNCLVQRRESLVHNRPGITRDTVEANLPALGCTLVDTAGIESGKADEIVAASRKRAVSAASGAHAVILVVDARAGLVPEDTELMRALRKEVSDKRIVLVANKTDHDSVSTAEFFELGLGQPLATSATHGIGLGSLREEIAQLVASADEEAPAETQPQQQDSEQTAEQKPVRIALLGKPNAGKSTLANRIAHMQRMIVSAEPGTTIDTVDIPFTHRFRPGIVIDMAGVRRRTAIVDNVEHLSARSARDTSADADVVLLLIDAAAGVTHQDQRLASLLADTGRAVVVVLTKADLLDQTARRQARRKAIKLLPHLASPTIMLIAAAEPRFSAKRVIDAAFAAWRRARIRFSASAATHAMRLAVMAFQPPQRNGVRPRLHYAHQAGTVPPEVAIHGRNLHLLTPSYKRYLSNKLASDLGIASVPLVLKLIESERSAMRGQ